ncbi:MAG: MFS transporter [Dehalococcoidia bacterium]|nr:MFS transporter [Dehalococcoidia bacterium]
MAQQIDPIVHTGEASPEAATRAPNQEAVAAPGPGDAQRGILQRTFWSLHHRNYRLLWFGSLFSSSGMWIQQVSIGWLTYQTTGSAFLLGAVNGFRSLPLLILGPFGGVAADRLDRKKLMFVTQMFLMTVTAAFATVVFLDYARVWNIILFSLLTGVGWAFNMPVRQSMVGEFVPRSDLQNAIALNSVGFNMTRIIGPSVSGLLIAGVGIAGNFYLQAAMYIGVAAMVWQMTVNTERRSTKDESILRNLADGARYVWNNRPLRLQMTVALLPPLLALPYVSLMPIFATDVLGQHEIGFGLLMAAPGVGAVVGTLMIASARDVKRRGLLVFICLIGLGGSLAAFSQSQWFGVSLCLLVLVGAFQMVYMSTNQMMLQMKTPSEYRGRVMGIYMLNQGLMPLGSLFAGTLAQFRGAPFTVAVMGLSVVVLSVVALFTMGTVRDA